MKTLLIFFVSVFPFVASGAPDCDMTFTLSNATIQATDVAQMIQQNFTISRAVAVNNRCVGYRLYFSKGQANSYQRAARSSLSLNYNYNLHPTSNASSILKDVNDALSAAEYLTGTTPARNQAYPGTFFLALPSQTSQGLARAGTYTDNIQVSVYRYNNSNQLNFEFTQSFTVSVVVATKISVSLVDEGSSHNETSTAKTLDFGNMVQNAQLGADLMIQSNTPYQIKASSLNNGKLKFGTNTVNYQFSVAGGPVTMTTSSTTPVTIATSSSVTTIAGARYNLKVKITDNPTTKVAGQYTDTITISAIAN